MGADRTIRPAGGFKPLPRRVLVVKALFGKNVLFGHVQLPMAKTLQDGACGVNYVFRETVLIRRWW